MSDLPTCVADASLLVDLVGIGFMTGIALAVGFWLPIILRTVFRRVHGVRDGLE